VFAVAIAGNPIMAQAKVFSAKDLKGPYACFGTVHNTTSGNSSEISELLQMNLDGNGGVSGTLHLLYIGEGDCKGSIAAGSNYSVSADGTGLMSLILSFSGPDSDGDVADCGGINFAFNPQKLDIIL
jgi:hypothetical protein